MSEAAPQPPKVLKEAMDVWLDAQHQSLELMLGARHPGHPVDWAEGYRWITRISAIAQEHALECSDPLRPKIFRSQGPMRKLMVDNPDVNYYFCVLSDSERYRLSGVRGGAAAIGLTIGTDVMRGAGQGRMGTLGQYQLDDFEIDDQGRFDIVMSKERPEGGVDWIPLPDGAAQLAVRETFKDHSREAPTRWEEERLGDPLPPQDVTPDIVADRLKVAARWQLYIANMCIGMWKTFSQGRNVIRGASGQSHENDQKDELRTHSATDMAYFGGNWKLEPDEALKVTIHPPEDGTRYWGITLVNPWMESHEYRERHVCTNNGLAHRESNGDWVVVISAEDPGVPNWLDTGGRPEGYALIRWVLPAGLPPQPTCEVVPVESLRA